MLLQEMHDVHIQEDQISLRQDREEMALRGIETRLAMHGIRLEGAAVPMLSDGVR